jgi:hypothetical protein
MDAAGGLERSSSFLAQHFVLFFLSFSFYLRVPRIVICGLFEDIARRLEEQWGFCLVLKKNFSLHFPGWVVAKNLMWVVYSFFRQSSR